MRLAVFLDPYGVLNTAVVREGRPCPPDSADRVVALPGAAEATSALKDAGFRLMVESGWILSIPH